MSSKTRPYRELLLERLANSEVASYYLNAALEDSPESFLKALKNVAQARQMSKVAKDAGVQRETLYRSFSEQGNPTFATLSSVLGALGMRLMVAVDGQNGAASGDAAQLEVHSSRA
jgi:probable addiction module antidote protein